jgi:hypothetical protein
MVEGFPPERNYVFADEHVSPQRSGVPAVGEVRFDRATPFGAEAFRPMRDPAGAAEIFSCRPASMMHRPKEEGKQVRKLFLFSD